jgi:hypothetical protein
VGRPQSRPYLWLATVTEKDAAMPDATMLSSRSATAVGGGVLLARSVLCRTFYGRCVEAIKLARWAH